MKVKRIGTILLLALLGVCAMYADETKKPAEQLADNSFFDPTRKQKTEEKYEFGVEYRVEAGYVQHWQRTRDITFADMYLHGVRVGGTATFLLPKHFSVQTGLLYTLVYGRNEQHWRSVTIDPVFEENAADKSEYITHCVLEHNLTIPVRAFYTIPLWKQLNLFFYTGPQLHIGLAEKDYMKPHLSAETKSWLDSEGIPTSTYDRMADRLVRANIQWGVGGGFEWDCYRLAAGYDFGLNNLVRHPQIEGQYMSEWGWFVSFSYRF